MAIRQHAMFRMRGEPAQDAAKAGCYVYGTRDRCVDTGVYIETEGMLTLGLVAIKELAEVAGFSVNEDGVLLEEMNAHLEAENVRLTAVNADLEEQLEAVGKAIARAQE